MHLGPFLNRFVPGVYGAYAAIRGFLTDRKIEREQVAVRAARHPTDDRALAEMLEARLATRGVGPKPTGRRLHVLYASRPARWERHNLLSQFSSVARLTTYFYDDRGVLDVATGRSASARVLDEDLVGFVRAVHETCPVDLFLGYLSGREVSAQAIRQIGLLGIRTCGFNFDDKLSFYGERVNGRWSGPAELAAAYDLNLTSAPASVFKYESRGALAAFWPEAANPDHFRPLDLPFIYDVSFVGGNYGFRPSLLRYLERNGVSVAAFGPGWPPGAVTEDDMVRIYAQSRINLGFGGIGYSTKSQCLKGRDFEVPMAGALYLTSHNPELQLVYEIDKEVTTYTDKAHCLAKIRALLADPDRCDTIRRSARARAIRDHTWAERLRWLLMAFKLQR